MQHLKISLLFLLYRAMTFVLAPLGLLFLCWKKRRDPPYGKRALELLGFLPVRYRRCIWFHTVSVGEVIAARRVIEGFVKRHPHLNVIVTTMTTTGAAEVRKIKGVQHLFAPLDSPLAVHLFCSAVKPSHLFIMETELWPNMLDEAHRHNTKVAVFNARMPEHTCVKYEKHRAAVKALIADKLDMVLCQTAADMERFVRIGVVPEKIHIANSLKYDLSPDEKLFASARTLKQQRGLHTVLGAISTHKGEEEKVIEAFALLRKQVPEVSLVLVPRHMDTVQDALTAADQYHFTCVRRSQFAQDLEGFSADILLGDTLGEIEFYLGLCDLVFMGGSFVNVGGHNPLEPAYFALPVLTGPHYFNFTEQFERMFDCQGAFRCLNPQELSQMAGELLTQPERLHEAGQQALSVQQQGRGALQTTLSYLEEALQR